MPVRKKKLARVTPVRKKKAVKKAVVKRQRKPRPTPAWMRGLTQDTIKRVQAGAKTLDVIRPDWFLRVDEKRLLTLDDNSWCMLGQVFQTDLRDGSNVLSGSEAFNKLTGRKMYNQSEWYVDHGFAHRSYDEKGNTNLRDDQRVVKGWRQLVTWRKKQHALAEAKAAAKKARARKRAGWA